VSQGNSIHDPITIDCGPFSFCKGFAGGSGLLAGLADHGEGGVAQFGENLRRRAATDAAGMRRVSIRPCLASTVSARLRSGGSHGLLGMALCLDCTRTSDRFVAGRLDATNLARAGLAGNINAAAALTDDDGAHSAKRLSAQPKGNYIHNLEFRV
jgi:hypothetical protein